MSIKSIYKKSFRYCIDYLRANAIGISVIVFAVSVFLTLFLFLKPNFFPNFMKTNFETDEERGSYMLEQLTR